MRFARYLLLLAAVLHLASCGGSGEMNTQSGRVRLVIHWPETRTIPSATQSLRFTVVTLITNDDNQIVEKTQVKQQVVPRPSGETVSTVILEDLPSVKVRVKATAHESTDGTGATLAAGSVDLTVTQNSTVNASLELTGGTIFNGSVGLTTQASVNALAGVTEITGHMSFPTQPSATDPITSIAPLASLTKVGGDVRIQRAGFSSLTSLSLPALTEIGGVLNITGSVTLNVHGGSLDAVSMSALHTADRVEISSDTSVGMEEAVSSVSLPSLRTVGALGVRVHENQGLESLTLGPLEILEGITGPPNLFIEENPDLLELHLGSIQVDGDLVIKNCPKLEAATGSGSIGQDLIFSGPTSMTTEEMGAFQRSFSVGGSVVPDFR